MLPALDTEASGPSYSVRRLAEGLAALGEPCEVWSVGAGPPSPVVRRFAPSAPRRLHASSALRSALAGAAGQGVLLHSHGVWLLPNLYPAWARARHVVSPRGMLSPESLAFSPLRKRVVWALAQGAALRRAAALHATSPAEAADLRALGLRNPVAVVPNGIDLPPPPPAPDAPRRTVLALGRLHPKKGLDRLLAAWALVEPEVPGWRLRIVGPSENGHGEALRRQAAALGLRAASVEGALFGEAKLAAYREAGLFVLPSLNENFGLVLAEALAAGTPAIASRGTPWAGLGDHRCGWWVDHGPGPLASALREALALPDAERAAMGRRGRDWMARDFAWEGVARRMRDLYDWLGGRADRPPFVVLD